MGLKNRIEKLESTVIDVNKKKRVVMIAVLDGKNQDEAKAEWEAENGMLTDDDMLIFLVGFSDVDKK
ncbi:MAG: hypothetical protein ACXWAT_05815 [Methylobacter sp.]